MQVHLESLPQNLSPLKIQHWSTLKNIKSIELKTTEMVGESFTNLQNQLVATCLTDEGIGLAAPQVGLFKRIIVCRDFVETDGGNHVMLPTFQVYVNPNFEPIIEDKKTEMKEYCLSVPEGGFDITRWKTIKISWQEYSSEKSGLITNTKLLTDFRARIFQHEFDHLNGISIPQRWQLQNKKSDTKKRKK